MWYQLLHGTSSATFWVSNIAKEAGMLCQISSHKGTVQFAWKYLQVLQTYTCVGFQLFISCKG
jgi:hypothetical protein